MGEARQIKRWGRDSDLVEFFNFMKALAMRVPLGLCITWLRWIFSVTRVCPNDFVRLICEQIDCLNDQVHPVRRNSTFRTIWYQPINMESLHPTTNRDCWLSESRLGVSIGTRRDQNTIRRHTLYIAPKTPRNPVSYTHLTLPTTPYV